MERYDRLDDPEHELFLQLFGAGLGPLEEELLRLDRLTGLETVARACPTGKIAPDGLINSAGGIAPPQHLKLDEALHG